MKLAGKEDPVGVSPTVHLILVSAQTPPPINTSDVDAVFARTNMATNCDVKARFAV